MDKCLTSWENLDINRDPFFGSTRVSRLEDGQSYLSDGHTAIGSARNWTRGVRKWETQFFWVKLDSRWTVPHIRSLPGASMLAYS